MNAKCGSCGAPLKPGGLYCLKCGARIGPAGDDVALSRGTVYAPGAPSRGTAPLPEPGARETPGGAYPAPSGLAGEPGPPGAEPDGERRVVTILYSDISGFTALSGKMEAMAEVADELYRALTDRIYRHGGIVDRHGSDAILAIFGAPIAREDDPCRAIRAAIEMQAAAKQLAAGARSKGRAGIPLDIRIGINTGPVVAGAAGATRKRSYTVMGEAVDVARHMEAAAPPGGILVAHDTRDAARHAFEFAPAGEVLVRGREGAVRAWELLGDPQGDRVGGASEGAALLARDAELTEIGRAWSDALHGEPVVLYVRGAAGLGKTALLREAFGEGACWVRATAYEAADALGLTSRVARRILGLQEGEPDLGTLRKAIRSTAGSAADEIETAELLDLLINGRVADSLTSIGPEHRRSMIFKALAGLLVGAARKHPVALVIDDLQWIDDGSAEFLQALFKALARGRPRILLALAYRPGMRIVPMPGGVVSVREIALKPLSREDSLTLLRSRLGEAGFARLGEAERERLLERGAGNPGFLGAFAELLGGGARVGPEGRKGILGDGPAVAGEAADGPGAGGDALPGEPAGAPGARGTVRPGERADGPGGGGSAGLAGADSPPEAVYEHLNARLDALGLSSMALVVLEAAAVLAEHATARRLAKLAGEGETEDAGALDRAIADLVALGILANDPASPGSLAFAEGLLQEAVYWRIPIEDRRRQHAKAARLLEAEFQSPAVVAEHFSRAELAGRAAEYHLLAAEHSLSLFSNHEALRHARAARDWRDRLQGAEPPRDFDWRTLLVEAEACAAIGELERAVVAARHMVSLAMRSGSAGGGGGGRAASAGGTGDDEGSAPGPARDGRDAGAGPVGGDGDERGGPVGERRAAPSDPDTLRLGEAYDRLADYLGRQGRHQEAMAVVEEGIAAVGAGTIRGLHLVGRRANSLIQLGDHAAAAALAEEALEKAPAGEFKLRGFLLGCAGLAQLRLARSQEAIATFRQALEAQQRAGNLYGATHCLNNLGSASEAVGQISEATRYFNRGLQIATRIGDRRLVSMLMNNLGMLEFNQGHVERAKECFVRALEAHREMLDRQGEGIALVNLGEVLFNLGEHAAAENYLMQALLVLEEIGLKGVLAAAYRLLAEIKMSRERYREALELLQRSAALAHDTGQPDLYGSHLRLLGEVYAALDRMDEAMTWTSRSLEVLGAIQAPLEQGRTYALLTRLLAESGRIPQAQEAARKARSLFEQTGARQDLERFEPLADLLLAGSR